MALFSQASSVMTATKLMMTTVATIVRSLRVATASSSLVKTVMMAMTMIPMSACRPACGRLAATALFEWSSPKARAIMRPVMTATTPTMMPV